MGMPENQQNGMNITPDGVVYEVLDDGTISKIARVLPNKEIILFGDTKVVSEHWNCPNCGVKEITSKFCPECGTKKPESKPKPKTWNCQNCGEKGLTSKFCPECGTKKPEPDSEPVAEQETWDCSKCGTKKINSKFCPECGAKKPETKTSVIVVNQFEQDLFQSAKRKNTLEALTDFLQRFPNGANAVEAQNIVGEILHHKRQNYAEAFKWYKQAAERGNAVAQNNLAEMYCFGIGIERNYGEGVRWFKKAAEQGDSRGQYNLASCYHYGWGVCKDDKKAMYWLSQATEKGDARAKNALKNWF